jgi:hypothetical protein
MEFLHWDKELQYYSKDIGKPLKDFPQCSDLIFHAFQNDPQNEHEKSRIRETD